MARSARLIEPGDRSEVAAALRKMLDDAEHARRIFLKAQVRSGSWRSSGLDQRFGISPTSSRPTRR